MTRSRVVVVDYGAGNVRSIVNALHHVTDDHVTLSSDPADIEQADRIVLPGVGAFGHCRELLDGQLLIEPVLDFVGTGRPFLGICVGMQILADTGLEFGTHEGLGLIHGTTRLLQVPHADDHEAKLPHVAWAPLTIVNEELTRPGALFDGVSADSWFYFVHSYTLECDDRQDVAATADYHETFTAAVVRENVFGCQFHLEKSGRDGLSLLANFCTWKP